MQCPKCGYYMRVVNSREITDGSRKRTYRCLDCLSRYRSIETLEDEVKPRPYVRKNERRV